MAKYYLFYKKNQEKHEQLSKFQFVEIIKKYSDYHEWYYWTEGLTNWKLLSQSPEVFEWLSFPWQEGQAIPKLPAPYENVEFNFKSTEKASETKVEPSVLTFSGQVLEFQDSIKEKYLNSKDFSLINESQNETPDPLEKTLTGIPVDPERFEKTLTSIETDKDKFENTQTISNINPGLLEKTTKIQIEPSKSKANIDFKEAPKKEALKADLNKNFTPANEESALPPTPHKHTRRYPRINGRLRTIITNKAKAFMTYTKDISLGGIQTENIIPKDIINTEIEVYISDPSGKKSILFRCHPVGDQHNPNRFSFAKADEKNLQRLAQWLEDLEKTNVA